MADTQGLLPYVHKKFLSASRGSVHGSQRESQVAAFLTGVSRILGEQSSSNTALLIARLEAEKSALVGQMKAALEGRAVCNAGSAGGSGAAILGWSPRALWRREAAAVCWPSLATRGCRGPSLSGSRLAVSIRSNCSESAGDHIPAQMLVLH